MNISGQASSATTAAISITNVPGALSALEIQIGMASDLRWGLSMILPVALGEAANFSIGGLNQSSRYFIRARSYDANNIASPWTLITAFSTPLAAPRNLAVQNVVMQPALFVIPEPVLSWAGASDIAGYPSRALGKDDPSCAWMAQQSGGAVSFTAQLPGSSIDTIAILSTTAAEDCQITLYGDNSSDAVNSGIPAYTYGPAAFRASSNLGERQLGYHSLVRLPAAQNWPWWRVKITGTMPKSRFMATYAVFGQAKLPRNISAGKNESAVDRGALSRDRAGIPNRATGFRSRSVDLDISLMTEADYEGSMRALAPRVGTTDPVLVIPNSKAGSYLHDRILYGQITDNKVANPYSAKFTQSFSIDSLI